ncbi:MAG: glycoside hydrolase family 65 protein [Oscillospiraceae bacterium]|nr:glycoside hydrolase family 65 protein [Oscillospiraceae bacterium]
MFFIGNGRIGIRGYLPYDSVERPLQSGLYMSGIFEEIKDGITDIVHLPAPIFEDALIAGKSMELEGKVLRSLNLQDGVFQTRYKLAAESKRLSVSHERFVALDNTGYIIQKTKLTAETDVSFEWQTGVTLSARNNPVPDDQVKDNEEILCLFDESEATFQKSGFSIEINTPKTGLRVKYDCSFRLEQDAETFYQAGKQTGLTYKFTLKKGDSVCIEKFCLIQTSRDVDSSIKKSDSCCYNDFFESHKEEWANRWEAIALPDLPDIERMTAARFAAAQLIMNGNANDETVSIGARGLTHPRYKGCYFWDTDFFLLPFYQRTHPQTAGNLVRYRIKNLPAAKKHALKTSAKGARYPWMASLDGSEQCESWDIGLAEVHITADVVFAIDQYIKQCGDHEIYSEAAAVYIETARFWLDRCTRDADGNVNLLFVKGPDEYCGVTNNNLFTNVLVKHNLKLACEAANRCADLGVAAKEIAEWEALANALPVPRNPSTGHLQQDETFHLLEPVNPALLKNGDGASYHKVSFDRVQRYKVIKQADLILLMTRFPGMFTEDEKRQAWLDYEPLCLHDSTLSFATHALFATQSGYQSEADAFLNKALFLDLRDVMGNTGKEGLHLANFGECWQVLVHPYSQPQPPETAL